MPKTVEKVVLVDKSGWTCCGQQKMPVKVWLNKMSCIPGETILFNATLDKMLMKDSLVQLIQV